MDAGIPVVKFMPAAARETLFVPVRGINFGGVLNPPNEDLTDGLYLFSAAQVETVAGSLTVPYSWERFTEVKPRVRWAKTTDEPGGVGWLFSYRWANPSGVDNPWRVGVNPQLVVPDDDTAGKHAVTEWDALDTTAMVEGAVFTVVLARSGGGYPADAKFAAFELEVTISGFGEEPE